MNNTTQLVWSWKYWPGLPFGIALLGMASLLIHLLPFRHIAPLLGSITVDPAWVPVTTMSQTRRARIIKRFILLASRWSPWNPKCLSQSIAARVLLGLTQVPYGLYLGMHCNADGELKAHAWVNAGPVNVCGGSCFETHAVVRMFTTTAV